MADEEDVKAEIDTMVADLEAESPEAHRWAIEELREIRADVEANDRLAEMWSERVAGWQRRIGELMVRGLALIAAGQRVPHENETAWDLQREAQRLREGKIDPERSQEEREEKARQCDVAAQIVRERRAIEEEVRQAHGELSSLEAGFADKSAERDRLLRGVARFAGDREAVRTMNRQRHRATGRRRRS